MIHTSRFPWGERFDPSQVALVEEPVDFKVDLFDHEAQAEIQEITDTRVVVRTQAKSPAFLVTSDIYYPGWKVTVDGQPAHLYQTDFVLRGVRLEPGRHEVRFEFHPRIFYMGLSVSGLTVLLFLGWVAAKQRKRK